MLSVWWVKYSSVSFALISEIKCLFMYLLAICISYCVICTIPFAHFSNQILHSLIHLMWWLLSTIPGSSNCRDFISSYKIGSHYWLLTIKTIKVCCLPVFSKESISIAKFNLTPQGRFNFFNFLKKFWVLVYANLYSRNWKYSVKQNR